MEGSWLTVLDRNLLAMLTAQHLAVNLWHLTTLELRNISTLLSGEGATLSGSGFRALSSRNVLALFLLDSLALSLLDVGTFFLGNLAAFFLGHITAFLLGNLATLLGRNLSALLRVVDLLADLLVDGITLPSVDGITLALRDILAFLLRNGGTFPLIHNRTLLLRNIFTDLILDSVTLPVVDDLALSHSVGGALLLGHGLALALVPGRAGLGSLRGTGFLVESFLDGSGNVDTLQLLGVVALLLLHGGTLLADIISCGAVPLDLQRTFSSLNLVLDRFLGDPTGSLLDIGTGLVWNISTLLPGHGFIGGLGNLVTDFLGHLPTHWLRSCFRLNQIGVELLRETTEGKKKA